MINLKEKLKDIAIVVLLVSLGVLLFIHLRQPLTSNTSTSPTSKETVTDVTTSLTLTPKTDDTDLKLNQSYVATLNGERLEVPLKTSKVSTGSSTAVVHQELDFTPMIEKMAASREPNWSVATGFGVHNSDPYVPFSISRHYKANKAVVLEVHLDPKDNFKVTGGELKHEWSF